MDGVSLEDRRHSGKVLVGTVHRGSDADLDHLGSRQFGDRTDVSWRVRQRHERNQAREINLLAVVVRGAGIGCEGHELVLAALCPQPSAGLVI